MFIKDHLQNLKDGAEMSFVLADIKQNDLFW
jgi:hypothetical protein